MRKLLDDRDFGPAIEKLAADVAKRCHSIEDVAFVGIHTRGVPLCQRLVRCFRDQGKNVAEGMLDINLYRDDLSEATDKPVLKATRIEFDVNGKIVFLVDDVLFTGRTIRAAMDAIFDLGRPKAVHLVVMAKRTGRELPIDTDLAVLDVKTRPTDNIKVRFEETDDKDEVVVLQEGEY